MQHRAEVPCSVHHASLAWLVASSSFLTSSYCKGFEINIAQSRSIRQADGHGLGVWLVGQDSEYEALCRRRPCAEDEAVL